MFGPNDPTVIIECSTSGGCQAVHSIIIALVVFVTLLTGFALTTVLERRFIASIQSRIGPNRVPLKGALQPAADGIKLIFKEDVTPANADKFVFWLAPVLKVLPALLVLAVVPLGPKMVVPWFDGNWYRVNQGLIDVEVGVLWILAITSLSVYGVTLAGWSSNNKYAMLGSLRSTASMISYELSMGTLFAVPILLAGSMSIGDIQSAQMGFKWFIFQNPLAAILFFIALMVEINRGPFDMPEAEQELVAGHMTEYSGMKFALFFMAEYINMIGISVIFSSMYLGGYDDGFGFVQGIPLLAVPVLATKVILLLMVMIWIRGTVFRPRYDRLMTFGWKVLLPLSILSVAWTSIAIVIAEEGAGSIVYWISSVVLFVVLLAMVSAFNRNVAIATVPDDTLEDPLRVTVGDIAVQVLGVIIAIPTAIVDAITGLIRQPKGKA
ncbi:MAG: NADH-quinone oxidoreductase subunit NuoH [Anaerolineales bacterium]|nr:NADH-quinone oxidoreductase subunit NuoH [Anaerolineales bacterium]